MSLTLNNIRNLIANHEGVDWEFKQTTGQLNRGMETLCGMLNGSGGMVVFGVSNNGDIVGQEKGDKTTREIGDALRKFDPAIEIQPQYIEIDKTNKHLIAFQCDGKEMGKPFMWDGKAYQRHDSVTSVMPREKFMRLYEKQNGLTYTWEDIVNERLSIADLDERLIHRIVDGAVRRGRLTNSALNDTTEEALQRFKVAENGHLCSSAALLFGRNQRWYVNFKVRLARFKGTERRDFIDNMQVEGNIFELVDAAMSFFFKHLSLSGTTHLRIERKDELEIPYDALREAVVNALCHRAWQFASSSIGIAIYDDRVEIENAGHFPANLEGRCASMPPNPHIANVMYLAGYIESWGRGLSMMSSECERVGIPTPKIDDSNNLILVTFPRENDQVSRENAQVTTGNAQITLKKDTVSRENDQVTAENDQVNKYNLENMMNVRGKTKEKFYKIINAIGEDWLTGFNLFEISGLKYISSFRRTIIDRLLEAGIIHMERPESPKAPNQRYGLTVKGKAIYYSQNEEK